MVKTSIQLLSLTYIHRVSHGGLNFRFMFVWSDLRYPNVTTGTKGCRDFIGKGVGIIGKASWENKLQPVIPVCNIILSQTPLFMDVGISICKCDIFLIHITCMHVGIKVLCMKSNEQQHALCENWHYPMIQRFERTYSSTGKYTGSISVTNWGRFSSISLGH